MQLAPSTTFREPGRRRSRRRVGVWAFRAAGVLIVFAIGLALGQALDDSSPPGGSRTSIRTIAPITLRADTVTVTVTTGP
jgi:hypothetical protein